MKLIAVLALLMLPVPSIARESGERDLVISETVEAVGVTHSGVFTVRYVLQKLDIYPHLKVEIFNRGYEGEPTVVHKILEVHPLGNVSDLSVDNVRWQGLNLLFSLGGKKCSYDLTKAGKSFEKAGAVVFSCEK